MSGLWLFLSAAAGPLALRVMAALGFGLITYTGLDTALVGYLGTVNANMQTIPPKLMSVMALAGLPQAVSMIMAAMTARVGMWIAASATRWVPGAGA